jgi:SprT-like family
VSTHDEYRRAASVLWGAGGAFAVDEYQRLNEKLFARELPPVPIVVGITAYGRCLGLTRGEGDWAGGLPRITLASNLFREGEAQVRDVLTHEMIHVKLILAGLDAQHNGNPWCEEIERLSPLVIGRGVQAKPVHPRRVDGRNRRLPLEGHLTRKELAGWPQALRDPGTGHPIPIASF